MIRDKSHRVLCQDDICLREISGQDSEFVVSLRNDTRVRHCFTSGALISRESHESFLAGYFSSGNSDEIYIIEKGGTRIGMISLYDISGDSAEWGRIVIDPACQGEGNGRRALNLIIQRARDLGVTLLYCHVKIDNKKAVKLYDSLGFVHRGNRGSEIRMELTLA